MSENNQREPWFSAKNLKLITEPIGIKNPITVLVLGICSALAVTVKLKPAFVMAISYRNRFLQSTHLVDAKFYTQLDKDYRTAGRCCRPGYSG